MRTTIGEVRRLVLERADWLKIEQAISIAGLDPKSPDVNKGNTRIWTLGDGQARHVGQVLLKKLGKGKSESGIYKWKFDSTVIILVAERLIVTIG